MMFLLGLFIGAFLGVGVTALAVAAKRGDRAMSQALER